MITPDAPLFDTNILIDALNGHQEAFAEFALWRIPSISAITLIELHAGNRMGIKSQVNALLTQVGFNIIHVDARIINIASRIRNTSVRRRAKIALADAIILATALARDLVIVTRNSKDFTGPNVRIPYELETVTTTRVVNVRQPPMGS